MNRFRRTTARMALAGAMALLLSCASAPVKKNYMLNYVPPPMTSRLKQGAYPFTVRIRELSVEEAYARPQIVYRKSPFELEYYFYRVWAVKPARMITDLLYSHLLSVNLVSSVVRRLDEGNKPDFELSGVISAIEEYDSDEAWFAHLSMRLQLARVSDGRVLYSRHFDHRKQAFQNRPELVVREMSAIMEFIGYQLTRDLDAILAREYGLSAPPRQVPEQETDSTTDVPETWQ